MPDQDILFRLETTLIARKSAAPGSSYVASLYAKGLDAVLKQVGEAAPEALLAAQGDDPVHLTREAADLLCHTLVMLAAKDIPLSDVVAERERREGTSGIDEKNARHG